MWRFFIELYKDDCYGNFVEAAETSDGLPICCDLNAAKFFYSVGELNTWVKYNTSLCAEKEEYGIKGVYFKEENE